MREEYEVGEVKGESSCRALQAIVKTLAFKSETASPFKQRSYMAIFLNDHIGCCVENRLQSRQLRRLLE